MRTIIVRHQYNICRKSATNVNNSLIFIVNFILARAVQLPMAEICQIV